MQFFRIDALKALPVLALLAAYAGAAFGVAGNVQFVIGDVKAINRAGATRVLQKGAPIDEGDRIVTGDGASAQIKMVDGGFIAVRPNTDMGFDTYRYTGKEDGTENAAISLLRGGFRTITGVIGRTNKQNYLVKTVTATIGIRGTDHEPMVILPPLPGRAAIAAPGTYDKVNVGIAFIRTDVGSVDIHRNQVGFAPDAKALPLVLPRIPPFYKPTPAPGPQKAKDEPKDEGKKDQSAAAPAPAAAEKAVEAPAQIRETAVVDPTSTVTAAPAPVAAATAPAAVAPVVEITATDASGTTLNTTTQTTTTSTGTTVPVAQTTTTPVAPPAPTISSPAVVANNYGFGVIASIPVTGGVDLVSFGSPMQLSNAANTNFVLSDNHLVEILHAPYERFGLTSQAPTVIDNANIKFTGGTAADTFNDPNGTYYMGRWSGGQIAVTDLATTNPVAPFADSLGTSSAHWVVGLTPGNLAGTSINNVQQLVGTASYALAAATHPTDGFGNVGTLNSATLAADFSAQTVDSNLNLSFSSSDPVNLSKRNLSLTAGATKMPIEKSGFGAAVITPTASGATGFPGTGNAVTCSGADCAAGGYLGVIGGAFLASASGGSTTGAVGTGAALNYGFTAIPTATSTTSQPFEDFITGAAVLSTGTAPTAGTTAVPVSGGTGSYRQHLILPLTVGTTTYNANYSPASGTVTNAQNYLFDASGNLVRVQSTDYKLSERGTSGPPSYTDNAPVPYTGFSDSLPSSPLTGASVSLSGGTAPDGNYNDTVNGIRIGRYSGGTITTTDFSVPTNPLTYFTPLGSNSVNWAVREVPASIPTTGSFEYTPAYATKPTDSLGNVGTLNYASLSADFTKQTVNPAVGITINNQNLASAATNVPIGSGFGFDVSSKAAQNTGGGSSAVQVKCYGSNCAPPPVGQSGSYGARIQGGLAGNGTAGGAFFRYDFNTRYDPAVAAGSAGGIPSGETRPVNDYIQGEVAFTKGTSVVAPAPATAASGNQSISTQFFFQGAGSYIQSWNQRYLTSPTGYTNPFGVGSPNSVNEMEPVEPRSETLTGGTVATPPTNANSASATGVSFGRYTGGTVSGIDWQNNAFSYANLGSYAWVKGPELFPYYVGEALTGTAKYVLDGGTPPGTTNGSSGTLNSAVLAVNFNNAAVGVDLSVTAGGSNFTATSTPGGALTGNPSTTLRLSGDNGFFGNSYSPSPALHETLYVQVNNTSQPYYSGFVRGQLTGPGLNGAGMTYGFQDNFSAPGFGVSGAVAFALASYTNTSSVTTTGTTAIDPGNVPYVLGLMATGLNADPAANPAYAPASVQSDYLASINGGFNSSFRLPLDAATGLPLRWDGEAPITIPSNPSCSPPCPAFVSNTPARFSIDPASFVATGASPGSGQVALPAGKSPATILESGRDAATGISWGRYGGGVIAMFDRVGGGFAPKTVDVSTQNWHGIFSPLQTGPVMLPTTGTYTYSKVGGTSPTDNHGSAAGTLNAATLVADFAAQTVNAGVNLTVNGQTWAAGGNAIPIQNRLYFEAGQKLSGGGNLNICVGGTCGTATIPTANMLNTAGRITGAFTGTSGQGVGMAYSLNQGGVTGTTVSGVAAFRR